jgi:hypothetical protein
MELKEFLVWLASGGGGIIAASWLLERWTWFQAKASEIKELILWGCATILSIGGYALASYLPEATIDAIAPYFFIVSSVFLTVVIGKLFHRVDKIQ